MLNEFAMLDDPVIAVIGAGAVGSYYGGRLALRGYRVNLLTHSDYQVIRRRGLRVKSQDGDFELPPDRIGAFGSATEMPKADWVIVTLKTTANDRFAELIGPVLKDETAILTLQNGLGNEAKLAELFGAARVMGGAAFVCVNRTGPGEIWHSDHGMIQLGEFVQTNPGLISSRCQRVAEIFRASAVECRAIDDLQSLRWRKLVWNIPFNGLGAILDQTTEQLLSSQAGIDAVQTVMKEVVATSVAMGLQFEPTIIQENIARTRTMGAYRTSTQLDRQSGRSMEIESMFGEPLRQAEWLGVQTASMKWIYTLLKLQERPGNGTFVPHTK